MIVKYCEITKTYFQLPWEEIKFYPCAYLFCITRHEVLFNLDEVNYKKSGLPNRESTVNDICGKYRDFNIMKNVYLLKRIERCIGLVKRRIFGDEKAGLLVKSTLQVFGHISTHTEILDLIYQKKLVYSK